jgi:hypothetical protein
MDPEVAEPPASSVEKAVIPVAPVATRLQDEVSVLKEPFVSRFCALALAVIEPATTVRRSAFAIRNMGTSLPKK